MTKKTIVIGAAAAALALGAGLALAAGPRMMMHRLGGPARSRMVSWFVSGTLDDLKATDAQRAKVLAVKDRLLAQAEKLREGHEAAHAELSTQWSSDKVDTAMLHALVDARVDELRGVLHQAVDGLAEVHDTLTPEQRRQLVSMIEELHGER
jgi:periplasmic protein CpxP/Spy